MTTPHGAVFSPPVEKDTSLPSSLPDLTPSYLGVPRRAVTGSDSAAQRSAPRSAPLRKPRAAERSRLPRSGPASYPAGSAESSEEALAPRQATGLPSRYLHFFTEDRLLRSLPLTTSQSLGHRPRRLKTPAPGRAGGGAMRAPPPRRRAEG